MAKRARGSVRPGQRRPVNRRPASSSAAPSPAASAAPTAARPGGLSEAELARAADLEAQLLADEKAAEQSRARTRQRSSTRDVIGTGTIALRAEEEYAYVGRDLKRIARIAAIELGILFVLYLVIDVTKVIKVG